MNKTADTVRLNNGISMPQEGYGVLHINDLTECERCIGDAIDAGYRLFDTATAYFNEKAVGSACANAIAEGKVKREELFLTTKVWIQDYGTKETRESVRTSLEKLGTSYIDLVLLHQPFGPWKEAWRTLEELYHEGKIRAIGTSNFTTGKLDELMAFAEIKPAVNQIELHPFYIQEPMLQKMKEYGIQAEAWGPLCEGQKGIFTNPVLLSFGENYGKTAAQIALRWNIQRGIVVIPKTTHKDRMLENLNIWDFELTAKEMKEIASLDVGHSEIIDFDSPATERLLLKYKIHA